jgi:hypothetical protein
MGVVKGVCTVNVDGRQTSEWLHVGSVWAGEVLTHPLQDLEVDGVARPSAFALGRHGELATTLTLVQCQCLTPTSTKSSLPTCSTLAARAAMRTRQACMSRWKQMLKMCMATAASAWRGRIQAVRGNAHSMATHSYKPDSAVSVCMSVSVGESRASRAKE